MKQKTLSDEIIGCKNCLGEWLEVKKVRKKVLELLERMKEEYLEDDEFTNPHHIIEEVFGKKLSEVDDGK